MNTKEAIEFLECEKRVECGHATQCKLAKDFNEVIECLKRGEKYEKIVNDLKNEIIWHSTELENSIKYTINVLEQKYFPKEVIK